MDTQVVKAAAISSAWNPASETRQLRPVSNQFSGAGWGAACVTVRGVGYSWSRWAKNFINDPVQARCC